MRRYGTANIFLLHSRFIHVATVADRLVAICHKSPTRTVRLSDLASASSWTSLDRSGLSKSLKKFLTTTFALAVFQHGLDAFAAVPRPCTFSSKINLASLVRIIEAARGKSHIVVEDQDKVLCLNVAWLFRSEIVIDISDNIVSVSLGQRQALQLDFITQPLPSDEYLNTCVYPLLDLVQDITGSISLDLLERLLCWSRWWPPLTDVCGVDAVDGVILLRHPANVCDALPDNYEECLTLECGRTFDILAITSLAITAVFDDIIPAISPTGSMSIENLDQTVGWGRYRYALGTLDGFLRHFHGVFFHVECKSVSATSRYSVTAVHIVARLLIPIFNRKDSIPLPALYSVTRWTSLFQPSFGPLQAALSAVGMHFMLAEGCTVVTFPQRSPMGPFDSGNTQQQPQAHESCISPVPRENPADFSMLIGDRLPVRNGFVCGAMLDKLVQVTKSRALSAMLSP
jgi:hypothetical protein